METKVFAALCALLLVSSLSADHSENQTANALIPSTAPVTEAGPGTTAAYSDPGSTAAGLNSSDPNPIGTGGSSNSTTTEQEIAANASSPEKNGTSTTQPPSQHPHSPSVIHPSASHTSDSTSTVGSTPLAHTLSGDLTSTPSPDYNASRTSAPVLPDASSAQPEITSSATVPTSPPPKPEHTSAASIPHATSSSSVSSRQPPASPSSSHTTSPDGHRQTTAQAQANSSTARAPNAPSAQAKAHTDNPSQHNVESDPTMVRDSSTLDPLLAGLVSAFIITAVIITLLLFLKLRRRDNRPEFRRLQDLPMDDMMEDTPLSMYSY